VKLKASDFRSRRLIWGLVVIGWGLAGVCGLSFGGSSQAPAPLPIKLFSDGFAASEYYTNSAQLKPQLKYRLTGRKATPVGTDRYFITQLHVEMFEEDGQRQATIEAPDCLYDFKARCASSPGPLKIVLGDGRMSVTGEGFLWQQAQASLIISNRVSTLVHELPKPKSKP